MEGDAGTVPTAPLRSYFYPRPHMEGDGPPVGVYLSAKISTHALTWRATANMLKCRRAFQQLI